MADFFSILTSRRLAEKQAKQVAIYAYNKDGKVGKTVITYEYPERLEATLTRLHSLNPGRRYTTKEA